MSKQNASRRKAKQEEKRKQQQTREEQQRKLQVIFIKDIDIFRCTLILVTSLCSSCNQAFHSTNVLTDYPCYFVGVLRVGLIIYMVEIFAGTNFVKPKDLMVLYAG